MIESVINFVKHLLSLLLLLQGLGAAKITHSGLPDFESAFNNDKLWPSHVQMSEDLLDGDERQILKKGIPVVLIRAYADGKLAVVDRAGTFLVDQTETDFLARVADFQKKNPEAGDAANFLHQIGRRVFDLDDGTDKAVPETNLARFDAFLICRTSSKKSELEPLLSKIDELQPQLVTAEIEPILVFEELMPNKEFYDHLKAFAVPHPVVVPVFQNGFLQAIFTKRETDMDFLLINKNGKLIRAAKTPSSALGN